ncbi:hypothetical protein T07_12480 [Trichinella nelsoni]|uniref:Uncharacterized protein n=1 Tax=Trichinella nelsoni TaxID=6336 RepID=A0A0V0RMF2_9BILA|nr:hypothetical protein T07_12480 [Trichinella nelsoni]
MIPANVKSFSIISFEPGGLYFNADYGGLLYKKEVIAELARKCACDLSDYANPSSLFSEVCSTDLSCFVSRSETNVARIAVRGDNGFVINILVLRAGEVGSAEVEPSGSRASSVENESFANEEKGRNPPFDFEKTLILYAFQLDALQLEFEEELEVED